MLMLSGEGIVIIPWESHPKQLELHGSILSPSAASGRSNPNHCWRTYNGLAMSGMTYRCEAARYVYAGSWSVSGIGMIGPLATICQSYFSVTRSRTRLLRAVECVVHAPRPYRGSRAYRKAAIDVNTAVLNFDQHCMPTSFLCNSA